MDSVNFQLLVNFKYKICSMNGVERIEVAKFSSKHKYNRYVMSRSYKAALLLSPRIRYMWPNQTHNSFPVNMPLVASTGPLLVRCWQHRTSTGPVLATNGMFMGLFTLIQTTKISRLS